MAKTVGGDMRSVVLHHAAELFAEQGYSGTSLRQVASASGLTMASVYHYFRTKEALAAEVVAPLLEGVVEAVARAEAGPRDADSRRALLTAYVEVLLADPLAARLLAGDLFMVVAGPSSMAGLRERLYAQLGGADVLTDDAEIRVTAALGLLLRPLVVHGPDRLRPAAPRLIEAATALLA